MALAFYLGWEFSLILLGFIPILGVAAGLYAGQMKKGMVDKMKAYAQSAGYAEQALYAIKVVHTYGQELLEY